MHFNSRLSVVVPLLLVTLLFTGCPTGGDKPSPEEVKWLRQFKAEITTTEKRFFAANYILNESDPFHLEKVVTRLSAGQGIDVYLKRQIQDKYDDYATSWDILTLQLKRTQMIFAVTSVLPSIKATAFAAALSNSAVDAEVLRMIGEFRGMVERGLLFKDTASKLITSELSPELRAEVLDLANKIAARALWLVGKVSHPNEELLLQKALIQLLNPTASESVGQTLSAREVPFIEDPLTLWAQLKSVYDRMFGELLELGQIVDLQASLENEKSRKRKRVLRYQIDALQKSLPEVLKTVKALRAEEAAIVKKLVFATEKQFMVAQDLASTK